MILSNGFKLMTSRTKFQYLFICLILIEASHPPKAIAQAEVMAWGNMTGIRVESQLMEFETSLQLVAKDWKRVEATGKERQQPKFHREGLKQTITTKLNGFSLSEVFDDCGKGCAVISVSVKAEKDTLVEGLFFCINVPLKYYMDAKIEFKNGSPSGRSKQNMSDIPEGKGATTFNISANGWTLSSHEQKFEISIDAKLPVLIRKEDGSKAQFYTRLIGPEIKKGDIIQRVFNITVSGNIDHSPVEIIIDSQNPGRRFDGLGGNFRLQNPKTDPQVIDYNLKNLRVAWGRVEMPWNLWHPDEESNPLLAARSGKINPRVHAAMKMAKRLDSIGMPVIISDWSAPGWAIIGNPGDAYRFRSKGIYGYPLNPDKKEQIYRSIGDYLVYLKQNYGVEAAMFSFNESDLGIDVRHTGVEHAEFIKGLGAHLESRGLATKLLLGDNSDATTYDFIIPSLNDPETYKYIGAVSFHSWRGCTDELLKKWSEASKLLNLPLIVAEGSTDAAAWNYPEIFSEQSFALYEINLYIRMCAICQPLSILQWQLTSDYSVLIGNGIFGTTGPLKPTQRFWNLKQLASTSVNSFSIPVSSNKESVNCAAFANISIGECEIHIVNNGAERLAKLTGLPHRIKSVEIYVTDQSHEMEKTDKVEVINGIAQFKLLPAGFTTLICR